MKTEPIINVTVVESTLPQSGPMESLNGREFRNVFHFLNKITQKQITLPCRIQMGCGGFVITKENIDDVTLGALLAQEEGWGKEPND